MDVHYGGIGRPINYYFSNKENPDCHDDNQDFWE